MADDTTGTGILSGMGSRLMITLAQYMYFCMYVHICVYINMLPEACCKTYKKLFFGRRTVSN